MKKIVIASLILSGLVAGCNKQQEQYQPEQSRPETASSIPNSPASFSAAKRALYKTIQAGNQRTFYCGCKYTGKKVDLGSCGVTPRKNKKRAGRIEAEHVFPASSFGQHRACWNQKLCTDSRGKPYGGRRCCEKIDPVFRAAHNDLHNLQPAVGEINGDRSNRKYGMIAGEPRKYGACDVEVDFKTDVIEPADSIKGDIARTYFYMRDTYGIRLSKQQTRLFEVWNRQDAVSDWERERNRRIKAIQGVGNKYIN